jgi:hypothetical protein
MKLDMNAFWKIAKKTISGSITSKVAAINKVQAAALSEASASIARPTVNVRALTLSVTIKGQKNSFQ